MCDVCESVETAAACCSALGPITFAYCKRCLQEGVEPRFMVEATYEDCGDEVAAHVRKVKVFVDGELLTWDAFVARKVAA